MSESTSRFSRFLTHLSASVTEFLVTPLGHAFEFNLLGKYFKKEDLKRIGEIVSESENLHRGEIRVAIETKLPLSQIWSGKSARDRALEMFSFLKIWDTEENTGILVYLLLAERKIVILADRGIYGKIGQRQLDEIAREIGEGFKTSEHRKSLAEGIRKLTEELRKHFPAGEKNPNELPDDPYLA
ncbi:hypothetical protein EHO61_15940 [Leptospira fluminis]|uniref:TPM domain-containing protein n=1 Tax=Leptospira fluminis TaxID=2484979 RepID=A0A4R9GMI6_9LEPT|nr:TPM domain-containing protein [Leptospira fluminis]TGK15177.1 hypothetical protein EHO61_15940 [Leptospira fluminis]